MNIKLQNVNYIYNPGTNEEKEALKNINLELGGEEFIAIIGSTGSGKSTLIQLLNGLIKPSGGVITWDGINYYEQKDEKKALRDLRCRVGMAFQYPEHQLFESEILKDVMFGPKNLGFTREEAEEKAKKALADVNMGEEYFDKSPFELSGGQMRRVALAGILAMEPQILILDEPTAGLDPVGKTEILDKVAQIQKERHMTVILVSHSMEEVAGYADRVIAMSESHILYDGPTHEVFRNYKALEEIGLKAPKVKYFMDDLKNAGMDVDTDAITIDEAVETILKAIR